MRRIYYGANLFILQKKGKKIIGGIGVSKEATEETKLGMGPHGVPMNPNLRNLSSTNLDQMAANPDPGEK